MSHGAGDGERERSGVRGRGYRTKQRGGILVSREGHTCSEAGGERWKGHTDRRTGVAYFPLLPWTRLLLSCDTGMKLPESLC